MRAAKPLERSAQGCCVDCLQVGCQLRFLKRQLSLPVSTMSRRWMPACRARHAFGVGACIDAVCTCSRNYWKGSIGNDGVCRFDFLRVREVPR